MSVKVIYLPGIGDHRPWLQDKILRLWRLFGLDASFHAIGWASGTDFDAKLAKIVAKIDDLSANGNQVALVGVSAGASIALNAYVQRKDKVKALVFICGKVYGTSGINPRYFQENPAFKESVNQSDNAYQQLTEEDKAKLFYVYTPLDLTVRPRFNRLDGVKEKKVLAFGHISGIYFSIIFHIFAISRFIKSRI